MKKLLLVAILSYSFTTTAVLAEDTASLAINIGAFDALDDETAAEVGVEYRFAPLSSFYNIIPAVGIAMNDDGSYWAHAGIRYDVNLSQNWLVTPHFAVAGYEQGGGMDLGHGLVFRSGVEVAYQFDSSRLGLGIYHLSNCGLGDSNPGEESVYLSYSMNLSD